MWIVLKKCEVLNYYRFLNPYLIKELKDIKDKDNKFSNMFSLLNFLLIFHIQ